MSVSSLHWRENRVREEIYKQDLKQIDTSAHETGLPKSNGATFAPREQKPEVRPAENKKKNRRLRWIILSLAILAAGGATWFWIYSSQFESTDDAYITGHEHPVSFRVSGTISEVLVDDNQLLKKGDPIARLDPRDFEVALVQARAQHLQAKAQLQQASVQIPLVEAQLAQARAQADSASFQSGTGAVYALLPPDNATGNFTKIVQRVPVKIRFQPASIRGYEQVLVPGLSTEPKIRVKNG
jgi:multidrug resistance efflux pump